MLGQSTFARYRELLGDSVEFPENGYQGGYIIDIAKEIQSKEGSRLNQVSENEACEFCGRFALEKILNLIRRDLDRFGVRFDTWFSEEFLHQNGKVEAALSKLTKKNLLYEKRQQLE